MVLKFFIRQFAAFRRWPLLARRGPLLRITQDVAYLQPRPQCVASGHISRSTITHLKCPSRRTRSSHPPPQSGAHSQQHLQSTSSGLVLNYAIAYVSHREYRDRSRFPSFGITHKGKAPLAESIANGALLRNWENGTCLYIPTYFPAAFNAALGPATSR